MEGRLVFGGSVFFLSVQDFPCFQKTLEVYQHEERRDDIILRTARQIERRYPKNGGQKDCLESASCATLGGSGGGCEKREKSLCASERRGIKSPEIWVCLAY